MTYTYTPKTKEWFIERIGKTIYRDKVGCNCKDCNINFEKGLIVVDEQHAEYLADIDGDFATDGQFMNYRDEK